MTRIGQNRGWMSATNSRYLRAALMTGLMFVTAGFGMSAAQAQTYKVLYSFTDLDGAAPYAGLIRDSAGNLYGTTDLGGEILTCSGGCGVVFKVDPNDNETVLISFKGPPTDGENPYYAGLVRDTAGNLYGTTYYGGGSSNCPGGCGLVFKLDKNGKETVLHTFAGKDGEHPYAGLIVDTLGNLYGTSAGGAFGFGAVFKLDKTDKESVLYSFKGGSKGQVPEASLIRDTAGNLYGTTYSGGINACANGCGTVFKLDKTGKASVLYSFKGGTDGASPVAGLVRDSAGNLYGTTVNGGINACTNRCGTVFKVDKSGHESVLYRFKGGSDGGLPYAGLVRDAAGNLYGTTYSGGAHQLGAVFKVDKTGHESVLYSFPGGSDGGLPYAGLIRDAAGNLYGTASFFGTPSTNCGSGCGVVFRLTP
jgi:uncharacterized repeat protein (TIGR03803 family)